MILVTPAIEHKEAAAEFRNEWGNDYIDGGCGLNKFEVYEDWLGHLNKIMNNQIPGYVPSSTYFGVCGNKIVGVIDIRHYLNEPLLIRGGHIGYGVRPSERRKGHATKMLALALDECRHLGIEKALLTCDKNNIASSKTIQKNGGVQENEFTDDGGGVVLRYWIKL
jgi:predicted acetyltransferase